MKIINQIKPMKNKTLIIICFWLLWALSIFYCFTAQVDSLSWATLISFVIFPLIGISLLISSDTSDNILEIFEEIIKGIKITIWVLFLISIFLVIIFIIGVIILAIIKWAFQIVF